MTSLTQRYRSSPFYESNKTIIYLLEQSETKPLSKTIVKTVHFIKQSENEALRLKNEYQNLIYLEKVEGIRKAYKVDQYDGKLAIWLEYIDGTTLKSFFNSNKSLEEFLKISIQLTDILDNIHQLGVIHKDINSTNILINKANLKPYIIDFESATRIDLKSTYIGNPEYLEGTLTHISPEQTGRMNRVVDYRSDLYSLGVTFFEALSRQLPFVTQDPLELVHSHIAKSPPLLHQINEEIPITLSKIIDKLLSKNAEDRYQSAKGLQSDLIKCLEGLTSSNKISDFSIGNEDFSLTLQIPQKLYGREEELQELLSSFKYTSNGNKKLVLVEGHSGTGKSSLVSEVHKPITALQGYFISGKFEQFQRNTPYSAITQALKEFFDLLLMEKEEILNSWRKKIKKALGNIAQVLIDVIPNLGLIIGEQPNIPELKGEEAQNRFNYAIRSLLKEISRKEHPLVIFIDDLQWADHASLSLLEIILLDQDLKYFMLIGAYRGNEVSLLHPVQILISKIQKEQDKANSSSIHLESLKTRDIVNLLLDTLKCPLPEAKVLAEHIFTKTEGNAFFIHELLKSFSKNDVFNFNNEKNCWQWNNKKIQETSSTDNVTDLMTQKIKRLPNYTQEVLKIAACIGNRFNIVDLSLVVQKSFKEVSLNILDAIIEGLIIPIARDYKFIEVGIDNPEEVKKLNSEFKFAHDKIQYALYLLIPELKRKKFHLNIAKQLVEATPLKEKDKLIFDIANHYNHALTLLTDEKDKIKVAKINFRAGEKAKESAAYTPALNYFKSGISLLSPDCWKKNYTFCLSLFTQSADAAFLSSEFDLMNNYIKEIFQYGKNILDKVEAYEIKISYLKSQNQLKDSIFLALDVLNKLGVKFSKSPKKLDILLALVHTKLKLVGKKIESFGSLPEMKNKTTLAAMQILTRLQPICYQVFPNLLPLVVFKQIHLSLKYGNTKYSATAYVAYGFILCGLLNEMAAGLKFGKLALALLNKFEASDLKAENLVMFNGFIRLWKEPLINTVADLDKAKQVGLDTGDLEYASYAAFMHINHSFWSGRNLSILQQELEMHHNTIIKAYWGGAIHLQSVYDQLFNNIKYCSHDISAFNGPYYEEEKFIPFLEKEGNFTALFFIYFFKGLLDYLFYNYEKAIENFNTILLRYQEGGIAALPMVLLHFYSALARLAIYEKLSKQEKKKQLRLIKTSKKKLKVWAKHAPDNFLNKYQLVKAELLRVEGKLKNTRLCYEEAIQLAQKNNFIQDEALSLELAGKFYLNQKIMFLAQYYINKAHSTFTKWGLIQKALHIESAYSSLIHKNNDVYFQDGSESIINTHSNSIRSSSSKLLDLKSVVKASQTISEEIILEKLLEKMMRIILENAGAERCVLLMKNEEQMTIYSELKVDNPPIFHKNEKIESNRHIPYKIINYVLRSQKTLVIDNALNDSTYNMNKYIMNVQPKSILCFPLFYKNEIKGIIYLENTLSTDVFTQSHIELLNLLSSQLAISLENAILYKELENKVEKRTSEIIKQKKELEEKNLQITASIRYAKSIQDAMLPMADLLEKNFCNSFIIYKPKAIVSGDFYWFSSLNVADLEKLFIAVVDCTGHGVPGALMSMLGYTLLNEIINYKKIDSPDEILNKLNEGIRKIIRQTNSNQQDGMEVSLCVIDNSSINEQITVTYAGAGRNLYFISDNDSAVQEIKSIRKSVGVIPENSQVIFNKTKMTVSKGTKIYLSSDGFVDQNNESREKFGTKKFKQLLKETSHLNLKKQKEIIEQTLEAHMQNTDQRDDITLIGIEI